MMAPAETFIELEATYHYSRPTRKPMGGISVCTEECPASGVHELIDVERSLALCLFDKFAFGFKINVQDMLSLSGSFFLGKGTGNDLVA